MPGRRSYSSIFYDGKNRLQRYTPVNNFNPQGITKGFLDIIASEIEKLYDNTDYISRAIDPTRAAGLDLENIGYLVGEKRIGAVTAGDFTNTNFNFYIDPKINWSVTTLINEFYSQSEIDVLKANNLVTYNESTKEYSLVIPQGTIVRNIDGTITYITVEPAIMTGIKPAYVGISATDVGPGSNVGTNVLIEHTLSQIPELRKIARYIKCTNIFPIQNGAYTQSDDQLRYRIATKGAAFQGNELAIRRAILQIPGIRDIMYEKNKFGAGTVHIIVDSVSPIASDGLIAAVKQVAQSIAAYGDIIFVSRPEYLGVELNFNIRIEPGITDPLSLRNTARNAIIQYINDLTIGGEIIWNKIVSIVLDIPGVVDFIPNYFKYGKYDIINKINKEQIVLRFLNQKAKYNQKWYTDSGLITCCII